MISLSKCGKLCITKVKLQLLTQITHRQPANLFAYRLCHDGHDASSFSNPSHILINNLPKCNKKDIIELVKPYGNIITCNGPIERYKFMAKDLPVKRYSFVHFESEEEASKALSSLNGTVFRNRVLEVKLSDHTNYKLLGSSKEGPDRLASYKPKNIEVNQDILHETQEEFAFEEDVDYLKEIPSEEQPAVKTRFSQIEELLYMLNRFNFVSKYILNKCVVQLEKEEIQNVDDAILVLRCTGALLQNVPLQKKMAFTERVWAVFEDSDIPLTVPIFNSLLRVYVENQHKFDRNKFLSRMQSLGLQPDVDTYGLLVSLYCEDGDIDNVSQILDYMTVDEIPITLDIFHFLMKGYFRVNDIDSAFDMMDVMRENEIDPVLQTYQILMSLFAEKGDMQSMKWVMSEMEKQSMPIKSYVLFDCIVNLVTNSHEEHVPEILTMLEYDTKYYKDAIACIKQLIQKGYAEAAYKIYLRFFEHEVQNQRTVTEELGARFILNALVSNEISFDVISPIICDMEERGEKRAISETTRQALLDENQELALQCFELMKKRGHTIRAHMLWPLFTQCKNSNDFEGLLHLLKKNNELVPQSLQTKLSHYMYEYLFPVSDRLGQDGERCLSILESEGIDKGEVNFAYFVYLAMHKNCDEASIFASNEDMAISPALLINLKEHPRLSMEWKSILQILQFCHQMSRLKNIGNVPGQMLQHILSETDVDPTELIKYFMSLKFAISKNQLQDMKRSNLFSNVPSDLVKELESGHIHHHMSKNIVNFKHMSIEELEDLLEERPDVFELKQSLMEKYCLIGNFSDGIYVKDFFGTFSPWNSEKVELLKSELETESFSIRNAYTLRCLIFFYAHYEKDINATLKYLDQLETDHAGYDDYLKALLYTLQLLSEEGNISDLMKHCISYRSRHFHKMMQFREDFIQRKLMDDTCCEMVRNLADKASVRRVLDVVFTFKKEFRVQDYVLDELIQTYADRGETDNMLIAFEMIFKRYQNVQKEPVYIHLIEKGGESDKIQRVLNLTRSVMDGTGSSINLMYSCVWCGKLKEANNILRTTNLRLTNAKNFENFCSRLTKHKKITELENLMKITRQMKGFDKNLENLLLIKGYVSIKDFEKAKEVVLKMEEENIVPSPHILRGINNQFKNSGIDPAEFSPLFKKYQSHLISKDKRGKSRERVENEGRKFTVIQ